MENGKSPGLDGIPIEFYQEFIEIIKKDLQKTYKKPTIKYFLQRK